MKTMFLIALWFRSCSKKNPSRSDRLCVIHQILRTFSWSSIGSIVSSITRFDQTYPHATRIIRIAANRFATVENDHVHQLYITERITTHTMSRPNTHRQRFDLMKYSHGWTRRLCIGDGISGRRDRIECVTCSYYWLDLRRDIEDRFLRPLRTDNLKSVRKEYSFAFYSIGRNRDCRESSDIRSNCEDIS